MTTGTATALQVTPATGVRRIPLWATAVVVIGALGVASLGYAAIFSPATMLAHGQQVTAAARTWARYAAAYDIALAVSMAGLLAARAYRMLAGTLIQAAIAEGLLAVVGLASHRWEQIPADIILIVAFALAARKLR
jgi:hypothetical protein